MDQDEQQVGAYRLHKHLEHSTIADAYLATHIPTNRQVMIKVFQQSMSSEQVAHCMASIHACARLEHAGILHVLDFAEEGKADPLFLVIDPPGSTLRQRHPQGRPMPLDTLAVYVSQIAAALQYAHNQHVLHLNLRPEQLFIGPDSGIMLDFTSRLPFSSLPSFIPEDALYTPLETPSPASDQYALAAIIYEWLSGTLPFSNRAREGTDQQRTLPAPGEPASILWQRIEPLLRRALALDPTQRYENVQTFADTFLLTLNVGPEAAKQRKEIQRQLSSGSSDSYAVSAITSVTTGRQAANWHNPFSTGFSFTMHNVNALAFSPDGKQLAFTTYEPAIYIATITEPGTIFTYQGHTDPVGAFAWSPDGRTIASFSSNETTNEIQLWEATTGKLLSTYHGHPFTHALQWSPDGNFIAIGGQDCTVQIWQPSTDKSVLTYSGHTNYVSTLAWSPDGTRIASAEWGNIHVWEAATATLICTYRGHLGEIHALAWSPDGTMIASGGRDMIIHIWNAATRASLFLHRLYSSIISIIGWSLDGKYVIAGTRDNAIQVHDVKDGVIAFSYHSHIIHTEHMSSIAWSPDLSMLAIGGEDRRVEIANRTTGKLLLCRAPAALVEEVGHGTVPQNEAMTATSTNSISRGRTTTITTTTTTMSPSGPPVVHTTTRQRRTVRVWGGKDGRDIVTYYGHASVVKPLAWSPDGSRIASGGYDGNLHVWDTVTSTIIFIYHGHLDPIATVAWSPDGTRLASGSLDHTVKIWDLLTGQEILTYREHNNFVQALAWSPDSTRIVSGSADNSLHVWNASNGTTILTYNEHTDAISSVSWSIDGQRIASGSLDQTVRIWEVATGNTIFVYRNHTAAVLVVAWSPDGQRIASSSAFQWHSYRERANRPQNEALLHIWTANADQTAAIYGQEDHPVHQDLESITWSPDGQMIAALAVPHPRIYDAGTGEALAVIMDYHPGKQTEKILNIAWSPDGTRIAGSMSNGRVQIWPAREQASR